MIVWIILILLNLVFVFIEIKVKQKNDLKKFLRRIFLLVLLFLIGFRYKIGWDYDSYVKMIIEKNWEKNTIEKIPLLIFEMISKLKLDSQMFFFLTTIVSLVCLNKFIKKFSNLYYLSFLIYFIDIRLFMNSISTVRQTLAINFFLVSFLFIQENKKIKGIIFFILGILSHISIIFTIPFLYFRKKTLSTKSIIFVPIFLILTQYIFEKLIIFIGGRYLSYLTIDFSGSSQYKMIFFNFLMGLWIVYLVEYKAGVSEREEDKVTYNLFKYGVLLYPLLNMYSLVLGRLVEYFIIFNIIVIPNTICELNKKNKKIRSLIILLIILSLFLIKNIILKQDDASISANNFNYKLNIKIFDKGED